MSDDELYRGDPPPVQSPPAPQAGPSPVQGGPGYPPGGYGHPGYGGPGYGQPGYGPVPGYPPGYGPPGYAPPGYPFPPYARPTNMMAILALVLAFVFAPAGLVLGIIARRQIRQTGEQGDGLALAGIIIGAIFCAFLVLVIVLWIALFASLSHATFSP